MFEVKNPPPNKEKTEKKPPHLSVKKNFYKLIREVIFVIFP